MESQKRKSYKYQNFKIYMTKKMVWGVMLAFICIILLGIVSAADTSIKIKTLSEHKVSVFVYETGKVSYEQSYHLNSDIKGEVSLTHSSSSGVIDVMVKVTKDGQKVFLKRFDGYDAGKPISIRLDYTEENGFYNPDANKNETPANNTPLQGAGANASGNEGVVSENNSATEAAQESISDINLSAESEQPVTGNVAGEGSKLSSIIYYVIGIFAVLLFVLLGIKMFKRRAIKKDDFDYSDKNTRFNIDDGRSMRISGGLKKVQPNYGDSDDGELKKVESEIKRLQEEVELIKNKEARIKMAEAKLEADKRELEKLRKGKF